MFRLCGIAIIGLGTLNGCVGTGALGVADLAVTGVSYIATGKSPEDNALSWLSGEDCRLGRMLTPDDICQAPLPPGGEPTMADAAHEPVRSAVGAVFAEGISQDAGAIAGGGQTDRYFVIASFDEPLAAARMAEKFHRLPVVVATSQDRNFHRIVAGPIVSGEEHHLRADLASAGITGIWPVALCRQSLRPPPCGSHAVDRQPAPVAPAGPDIPPADTYLVVETP